MTLDTPTIALFREMQLRADAAESELRETREALERAASILARAIESFGMCALGSPRGQIKAEARAFLARLPTEEE